MNKTDRAMRRRTTYKKALRKRKLAHSIYPANSDGGINKEYYDNLHQYSKNKIHCSCGMCSRYHKTNNRGKRRSIPGNYAPSYNPSPQAQRNDSAAEQAVKEYLEEET